MSNNYSQIFIEDLIDYFEEDAVYVKFYKKNDPAFHKDGQLVSYNLVYVLGLIDRLKTNDPYFMNLFAGRESYFKELKDKYANVKELDDARVKEFRELMKKEIITDKFLFDPNMAQEFIKADKKVMKQQKGFQFTDDSHFPDGTDRKVATIKVPYKVGGKILGILGFSRDISDIDSLNSQLIEGYPGSVIRTTRTGKITFYNQATLKLFNYSKEEFEKLKSVKELYVKPSDRTNLVNKLLKGKKVSGYEVKLKRKDGNSFKPFHASIFATVKENQNKTFGFYATIIDISKTKERMNNLQDSLMSLSANIANSVKNLVSKELLDRCEEDIQKLNSLSPTQREVFNLYVHTEASPEYMAKVLGLAAGRVSNIETDLKLRLKTKKGREGLREFARRVGIDPFISHPTKEKEDELNQVK